MKDKPENRNAPEKKEKPPAISAADAPTEPGCYLMRDEDGVVLYVGKAINLRNRIRSYIQLTDSRYSVKFLMRRVASVEYLTVSSEKEALLLENTLIKLHKPRYNVRLRDDKTFISLRIHPGERFPRLTVVRRRKKDGARYFGPYHDTKAARKTLKQLQKLVPLRTCSDSVLNNRSRPCIYYQIKQCKAPCVGFINEEEYAGLVEQVLMILEGKSRSLEKQLREEITALAEQLRFEEAAVLRDRLVDLQTTLQPQHTVALEGTEEQDVFGMYAEGRFVEFQVLYYRNNAMTGGDTFSFDHVEVPLNELFSSFILQFYEATPVVPKTVVLPVELEDQETLTEILSEKRERAVTLTVPKRGRLKELVKLAEHNAEASFISRRGREKALQDGLEQIAALFKLPAAPTRIECFDISTHQGDKTVAAMSVLTHGEPDKSRYRRYQIKSQVTQDDFNAMREVLTRRFSRAIREADLPDLVLIDGGKGHLNIALSVLRELGLSSLPCVSIAEGRTEKGAVLPERFFLPGRSNPLVPPQGSQVVRMLAGLRNEAHRFAITYHRKKRSGAVLKSALSDIPGVGTARARALLETFGSVKNIMEATSDQLARVPGISAKLAEVVHRHLHAEG
ncbi:MAG TPA: excinuclease ABC subunit UvrC [Candidatus Hydrogenedentes bacterium]|jgi:excinuclease ABC subunit C|nr:excinuclease ABC subunit UvrC [Candidatus Hydrogenedentota bacterium]HOD95173.1 excinuclease ABC subunit UvrC [Candidatus Hydrogenedentota bacterium]HOM49015.1 excinuclease ABC subunit UvrC [Candidatus Hydrogenedentota bacterium]HOR50604.1 excinuclease ABC subunit UvrC [Candidatus Hydrogenedentota bacterium]HPK24819.1 excinuclease ABC subunit UvrC [Candidatus Hydrogenedentota bacterium]